MAVRNKDAESCVIAGINTWNIIEVNSGCENTLSSILTKVGFKSEYPDYGNKKQEQQQKNKTKKQTQKKPNMYFSFFFRKKINSFIS